jgi:hypothetical protein
MHRSAPAWVELAAKLMHEESISDPHLAIQKAKKHLRDAVGAAPRVDDVLAALRTRLRLFAPNSDQLLGERLNAAIEAMEALQAFEPRLFGALAEDIATPNADIQIEVIAEHLDDLRQALGEMRIPAEQMQTLKNGYLHQWFEFRAGAFSFQVHVQDPHQRRQGRVDTNKLKKHLAELVRFRSNSVLKV